MRQERRAVIALLAIGIPILVVIAFAWFRAAADRGNRRSMRRYGSALDRLGDVARRSDAVAPVHVPPPEAIARPHFGLEPQSTEWVEPEATILQPIVRLPTISADGPELQVFDDVSPPTATSGTTTDNSAAAALARMVARSRSAHEATSTLSPARHPDEAESVRLRRIAPQTLQFSDLETGDAETSSDSPTSRLGARRGRLPVVVPPQQRAARRRLFAIAGVVVVLVAAGIAIALQRGGPPVASSPTTTVASTSTSKAHHPTTTTTLPSVLRPTLSSTQLVVYTIPTRSYVVRFSATAACWLGSQKSAGGKYLWMDTLSAGQSTTYTATGTRIIRLGAPKAVSLTINGIPVQLPTNNVLSYMLKLQPTTS